MRRFQSSDSGAPRFWQAHVDGESLVTEWGEVANERQATMRRRRFGSAQHARDELERAIRAKLELGWIEAAPTPLGPDEVDLEAYASGEDGVDLDGKDGDRPPPEGDDLPLGAVEQHRAECRAHTERWVREAAPVPTRLLAALWVDPEWRAALLEWTAVAAGGHGGAAGALAEVDQGRFALLTDRGELLWLAADVVVFTEGGEAHV